MLVHSMAAFSILGFRDLNSSLHARKFLYIALTLTATTIFAMWLVFLFPHLIVIAIIFWVVFFLTIHRMKNLNLVPVMVNLFVIVSIGLLILLIG